MREGRGVLTAGEYYEQFKKQREEKQKQEEAKKEEVKKEVNEDDMFDPSLVPVRVSVS